MRRIQIGSRAVGEGEPCFVIAEAGSNHDGDLEQAKALVRAAASAGADAVKFQTYTASKIAARTTHEIATIEFGGATTMYELYANTEMPQEWLPVLRAASADEGITFLSTPFDTDAVDLLDGLGVPAFKIASFEAVDLPLLRHTAKKGKPVILSTGMATLGEVEEAVVTLREAGLEEIVLLHCAINYPAPYSTVNLAAMDTMSSAFGLPVGYSDHTLGLTVPIAAVARGAKVIEKHFTISRDMPGPDHGFSLEPEELTAMVRMIRETESSIGSAVKQPTDEELLHRRRGRRSLFAAVDISEGEVITTEMIAVLRPGVGLHPRFFDIVVGRPARRAIAAHEPLSWDVV